MTNIWGKKAKQQIRGQQQYEDLPQDESDDDEYGANSDQDDDSVDSEEERKIMERLAKIQAKKKKK